VSEHLPILQVAVPLLAAPLCVLFRSRRVARAIALSAAWLSLLIAVVLQQRVLSGGTISYALGGWPPPIGIEYRITVTNSYLLVLVAALAALVLSFDTGGVATRIGRERHYLYYAAFLLCISGLLGMSATGDAFNVFVFLEVSSLSSYALISTGVGRRALTAAYSYLIAGTIGGTFVLVGVGLMYQMTGTLNLEDLATRLPAVIDTRTVHVAFVFLTVGLGIKLAVFPVHQWLPNAYTYAPSKVSAFLAGTATKVSYYLLVRMIFTVFGAAYVFGALRLHYLLLPLSLLAMFVGTVAAIYQDDVKRLLAYSSIAQIGYLTLGLSLNSTLGLTGGLVHMFNHGVMKAGLFLVVASVILRTGSARIADFAGLGRTMPLTSAAFVVGGLSLVGVPGTVGFVSKWYLVAGALERGWVGLALLILLSSVLALAYVWRVVEVLYFRRREDGSNGWNEAPLGMLLPTWILIGAAVYFGLETDLTVGVATRAASELLGALP
jgi:multicomponent Na+:H+ antiporter subunit D